MALKLTIAIEGKTELLSAFLKAQSGMIDLRKLGAWDTVVGAFRKIMKAQFATQGAAGAGGAWKQLSPAYKKWKDKTYGPLPILQATKRLYSSLTSSATGSVVIKEPQNFAIGTNLTSASGFPYPDAHQKGGPVLPQRQIISLTQPQKEQLVKPLNQKLRQLMQNLKLYNKRGF
jgi:phage gpG-like protein